MTRPMADSPQPASSRCLNALLLVLHCLLAMPLTFAAAHLGSQTLAKIVRFQPGYPSRVTMAVYTPLEAGRWFHLMGTSGLWAWSVILLGAAIALAWRRHSAYAAATLLLVHTLFLAAAISAFGFAANQLAGVAVPLAGR